MPHCRPSCLKRMLPETKPSPRTLIMLLSLLMILLLPLLMMLPPAASAPTQAAKSVKGMDALASASTLAGSGRQAVTYPCYVEGLVWDLQTGAPVKGAAVTCVNQDGERRQSWSVNTSDAGRYRMAVPEGSYTCIATHSTMRFISCRP